MQVRRLGFVIHSLICMSRSALISVVTSQSMSGVGCIGKTMTGCAPQPYTVLDDIYTYKGFVSLIKFPHCTHLDLSIILARIKSPYIMNNCY